MYATPFKSIDGHVIELLLALFYPNHDDDILNVYIKMLQA